MLAEGLALTLTLSQRERELACGCAVLESLFSTSAFFARMLAEGHADICCDEPILSFALASLSFPPFSACAGTSAGMTRGTG